MEHSRLFLHWSFIISLLIVHKISICYSIIKLDDYNQYDPEVLLEKFFMPFREKDPKGLPVLTLPSSFTRQSPIRTPAITLYNYSMTALSNMKVIQHEMDFVKFKAHTVVDLPITRVSGYYKMPGLWKCSSGEINVELRGVTLDFNVYIDFNGSYVSLAATDLNFNFAKSGFDFNMTETILEHQILISSDGIHTVLIPLFHQLFSTYASLYLFLITKDVNGYYRHLPMLDINFSQYKSKTAAFMIYVLNETQLHPVNLPPMKEEFGLYDVKYVDGWLCGLPNVQEIRTLKGGFADNHLYVTLDAVLSHLVLSITYEIKMFMLYYEKFIIADIKNLLLETKIKIDPSHKKPIEIIYIRLSADALVIQNKGGILGPIKAMLIDSINDNRGKRLDNIAKFLKSDIKKRLYHVNIEEVIQNVIKVSKSGNKPKMDPYKKPC